jgi:hypothetical protein
MYRQATVDEVLEYIRKWNALDDDKQQDDTSRRHAAAL